MYKITLGSIPSDWKHLLRTETSQNFLSCTNLFISLRLNPAIHRMGNAPNIVCLGCKEQKESQS